MATVREKVEEYLGRLKNHEVADVEGRATRKLAARVKVPVEALYPALKRMEHDGILHRDTHGKRTFAIRLTNIDELDPTPPAHTNGAVVSPKRQRQLDAVLAALEEHEALLEENGRLQKELGKAERTIEAQSLEIAALKRHADGVKDHRHAPHGNSGEAEENRLTGAGWGSNIGPVERRRVTT